MKQLLIVDEDINNRALLNLYLTREGYKITEACNAEEALKQLKSQQIDLAIIDVKMSSQDDLQLCKYIRSNYDIPFIIISSCDRLEEKERGFLSGADDYVTKPFEPIELLYRIKALFRRYSIASSDIIKMNTLVINRKNLEITDGKQLLLLPLKEFELLAQLAQYPGRLFAREELIRLIWGADYAGDERTVDVHIKRIRKRFSQYKHCFQIRTIRGSGYKLETYNK